MLPREPAPLEALPAAAAGAAGARPVCATLFPLSVSLAWPVPLFLGPRPGWPRPSPAQPPDIIWLREKGPCMDGQLSHTHTHTHISPQSRERERTLRAESQSLLRSRISLGGLFSVQLMHARSFPASPHYQSHPSRQPRTHARTHAAAACLAHVCARSARVYQARPTSHRRARACTHFLFLSLSHLIRPSFHSSQATADRCDDAPLHSSRLGFLTFGTARPLDY